MSGNKYTARGFGASSASQSSWSAPRESYKAPKDHGTNFLFGGSGLRGSPTSGSQHRSAPSGASTSALADRLREREVSNESFKEHPKGGRGIDLSGGDITTSKLERIFLFVGLLIVTIIMSTIIRACSGGSDSSWVDEHRATINPDG